MHGAAKWFVRQGMKLMDKFPVVNGIIILCNLILTLVRGIYKIWKLSG